MYRNLWALTRTCVSGWLCTCTLELIRPMLERLFYDRIDLNGCGADLEKLPEF